MNVSGSLVLATPLDIQSETMAKLAREFRSITEPAVRQMAQLAETMRHVGEVIARSPYVKAQKTKARLVAFLLSLIVRDRRSTVGDAPTSRGVAFDVGTFADHEPPPLVPVLATHRGSNAPNETARVSQLDGHLLEAHSRKALTKEMR